MCVRGAHRCHLVDDCAQRLHQALLRRLDRTRRFPRHRRNLFVRVSEEPGKAATHSIERSATYTCCSNMSTAVKKRGHEHKDVDVPSLFTIALLLFLSGALIFFVVWAMMHYLKLHELGNAAGEPNLP